ncbi:MAG: alpha/beta fold hydrolase [Gemmatimonadetes bacterium]|nr:alpha/beta fold hydrolase [Gemmatimonadota bacterium]MDA1104018.1 alpha/beta fold hydrolase [Gemmatimonadota bacterium]
MRSISRVDVVIAAIACCAGAGLPDTVSAQRARQGLLSLEDARLFYEVVGTGEPIIVVHGGPGLDHAYLQPGLDALATLNTVVYYDQRGTGRSTAAFVESAINIDAFVDDIDALRQALGYERVSVLGHSFGTLIALAYAERYPESLRSLILMNPVEPGSRYREETAERQRARVTVEDSTEMAELRGREGFAARDAATLSQAYRVAFRQTLRDRTLIDQLDLELADATAENGQSVAILLGASLGEVDWWDRLGDVRVPTLVLHGRYDTPPIDMSRELAEALPLGSFEVLNSGHFPFVEDRTGLLSAISAFFAGLRR